LRECSERKPAKKTSGSPAKKNRIEVLISLLGTGEDAQGRRLAQVPEKKVYAMGKSNLACSSSMSYPLRRKQKKLSIREIQQQQQGEVGGDHRDQEWFPQKGKRTSRLRTKKGEAVR